MQDLIVVGGGEHARVVIEAARSAPSKWRILGFVDPSECAETVTRLRVARLGDDEALANFPQAALVIGVGPVPVDDPRQRIARRVRAGAAGWATVIHASAWVSPTAALSHGAVILAGAVINTGARIGPHCVINSRACIEHDAALGEFVHAAPGSTVGGGARIGSGTFIGLGAQIRDHVEIGSFCLIGMGAVVTGPCPDGRMLAGVPARSLPLPQRPKAAPD